MFNKNVAILLFVLLTISAISMAIVPNMRKASLETDRAVIKTAMGDYYSQTGSVALIMEPELEVISPAIFNKLVSYLVNSNFHPPITKDAETENVKVLSNVNEEDIKAYVKENIFPLDKPLLRQFGSLGKLNDNSRLWLGDKNDPSFLICEDDLNDETGWEDITPPINDTGDLNDLTLSVLDIDIGTPNDCQMLSPSSIVVVGSNGSVKADASGDVVKDYVRLDSDNNISIKDLHYVSNFGSIAKVVGKYNNQYHYSK